MNFRIVFLFLIVGCSNISVKNAMIVDNNLHLVMSDGNIEQVTFMGKDDNAILSPQKQTVYFVRKTGLLGTYEYNGLEQKAIYRLELSNDYQEELLLKSIKFEDREKKHNLFQIINLKLSIDEQYLLFTTNKWSVSNTLIRLNPQTKEYQELTHADDYELVKKGKYVGNLIVSRSNIKAGRQWTYWLIDIEGNDIKEIGYENALKIFKEKYIQ